MARTSRVRRTAEETRTRVAVGRLWRRASRGGAVGGAGCRREQGVPAGTGRAGRGEAAAVTEEAAADEAAAGGAGVVVDEVGGVLEEVGGEHQAGTANLQARRAAQPQPAAEDKGRFR